MTVASLSIGPSLAGDFLALVELYNAIIEEGRFTGHLSPLRPEDRLAWFREHRPASRFPLLVARDGNVPVGFAHFSPYRSGREAFETTAEVTVHISRAARSQGLGSRLLGQLLEDAPQRGVHSALAYLFSSNEPSRRMLERHGFQSWGNLPSVVRHGTTVQDHLILGRHLTTET